MPFEGAAPPGRSAEARRIPGVSEAVTGEASPRGGCPRAPRRDHPRTLTTLAWSLARVPQRHQDLRQAGRLEGVRRARAGDDLLTRARPSWWPTGSAPLLPPIEGLREAEPGASGEATTAEELLERLASWWRRGGRGWPRPWRTWGSQVTLVEAADRPIPRQAAVRERRRGRGAARAGRGRAGGRQGDRRAGDRRRGRGRFGNRRPPSRRPAAGRHRRRPNSAWISDWRAWASSRASRSRWTTPCASDWLGRASVTSTAARC